MRIQNKLTVRDQESIDKYLKEVYNDKNAHPLTTEKEKELFSLYHETKDPKIKTQIIKSNLRWVITVAKQYVYSKIRLEDLINEGNIALINNIDNYDHKANYKFIVHLTWHLRKAMRAFIYDIASDIQQPYSRLKAIKIVDKCEKILISKGNLYPTYDDILELYYKLKDKADLQLKVSDIVEIKHNSHGFISMETQTGNSDDFTLENTFKTTSDYNPDNAIKMFERNQELMKLLSSRLDDRELIIVEFSFGINGKEEKTPEQISDIIGLTRERIGQILHASLIKLKPFKGKLFELCGQSKELLHSDCVYSKTEI